MPQENLTQALEDDGFDFDSATAEEYETMLRTRMAAGRDAARKASEETPNTQPYFDFYAEADELVIQFNVLIFKADKARKVGDRQQATLLGANLGAMYGGYLKSSGFVAGLTFQTAFQEGINAALYGIVPEGTISVDAKNGKGN